MYAHGKVPKLALIGKIALLHIVFCREGMRIRKAVVTAAGRNQSALPLQTLIDRDGAEKSVLRIVIEEALTARIEEICVVISPANETAYAQAAGDRAGMIRFVHQRESIGYGHALYCAKDFVKEDPFLHLVGDHLYVSADGESCAQRLVKLAEAQSCTVSAVQPTLENLLRNYGAVGGQRAGDPDLYRVETVIEKPTPTEAEQKLIIPGMRAGHYLCFFGMHALTPAIMQILGRRLEQEPAATLSSALDELAKREQYLALATANRRYDVGVKYGLLRAQLALALSGRDREEVLSQLVEVVAQRA
jgi:UTP--glucose-1-phosphate uridylyltransferase